MYRFLLYILIAYVVFFIIRTILRLLRRGSNDTGVRESRRNKQEDEKKYDKSKAVDADYEDLK